MSLGRFTRCSDLKPSPAPRICRPIPLGPRWGDRHWSNCQPKGAKRSFIKNCTTGRPDISFKIRLNLHRGTTGNANQHMIFVGQTTKRSRSFNDLWILNVASWNHWKTQRKYFLVSKNNQQKLSTKKQPATQQSTTKINEIVSYRNRIRRWCTRDAKGYKFQPSRMVDSCDRFVYIDFFIPMVGVEPLHAKAYEFIEIGSFGWVADERNQIHRWCTRDANGYGSLASYWIIE